MKRLQFVLLSMTFLLFACGSEPAVEEKDDNTIKLEINGNSVEIDTDDQKNLKEAINKSKDALNDLFGSGKSGEDVEVVSFRDLKEFMPRKLGSMKMDEDDTEGQTSTIAGFKVSTVSATYRDDDAKIDIKIIDPGSASTIVNMMASWSNVEIDSESGTGYQRTLEYKGYKAFEQYNSKSKNGTFAVMVENRFIVTVKGDNVDVDDLKNALDDINIKKLARQSE